MKKTKLLALILTVILIIAVPISVSATTLHGWVQNEDLTWSYYYDGYMYKDTTVYYNGQYYYLDENGIMETSSWITNEYGSKSYASAGGELYKGGIYEINGKNYFFNNDCILITNPHFGEYDSENDKWFYCFAKDDGSLYRNEWINYGDEYYYVGDDSKAYTGVCKVGNDYYAFDDSGSMYDQSGFIYIYDNASDVWVYIYVKEDGKLLTNDWYEYTESEYEWQNGWLYFGENGIAYDDGVYKIGSNYYYFFSNSMMADDEHIIDEEYDEELGEWVTIGSYRAKPGGALYINSWYKDPDWNEWYYYGEGGKAPYGPATIDGKTYLFDKSGRLITNNFVRVDVGSGVKNYYGDENGYSYELKNNDWTRVGDDWFYVQDGEICANGIYTIGGKKYYFSYDGCLLMDSISSDSYWDDEIEDWLYTTVYAKEDGVLAVNEWIQYHLDWYYFGNDAVAYSNGVYTIGGKLYYFDEYGIAAKQDIVSYNGTLYTVDEDCILTEVNGWFKHPYRNDWMYEDNGYYYSDGIYEIGGKQYFFNWQGTLLTDRVIYTDAGYFVADPDGAFITTPGWKKVEGQHVYVTEQGYLHIGLLNYGGNTYYMAPGMLYCKLIIENDKLYAISESGVISEITADGIYDIGYCTVYIKNGKFVKNDWEYMNGNWYYFGGDGEMYTNGSYTIEDKQYYFYHDGTMAKGGWILSSYSDWLWADDNGVLFTGLDANGYFFNEMGYLCIDEIIYYEDKVYLTNNDGVATLIKKGWNHIDGYWYYMSDGELYYEGYYEIEGKTYCFDYNGRMVANRVYNDRWYDADGNVITGWIYRNGYWYYGTESEYDYGNLLSSDIYVIDGKEYYFDWDAKLYVNGVTTIYGEVYAADENGVLTKAKLLDGWSYADNGEGYGVVIYYENGKPYTGWVGDYYIDEGIMAQNRIVLDNQKYYYIKKDGTYHKSGWIKRTYEDVYAAGGYDWYFAKSDGSLCYHEWLQQGNDWYYFDEYYMVGGGEYFVDGEYHIFDGDGKWLGKANDVNNNTSKTDGWHKENGKWFFYMAGQKCNDMHLYSNGDWFYLDYDGEMVTNEFIAMNSEYYDAPYCYYGADGKRVNYTGWKYLNNNWVYFSSDSSVAYGWLNDGENDYYLLRTYSNDSSSSWTFAMATGYRIIYEKLYNFASNGVLIGEVTKDGWYETNYGWVYIENGKLLIDKSEYKIGGAYYAFDYDGYMLENSVYECKYYGSDGKLVTTPGWNYVTIFGRKGWMYIRQDGIVARGIQNIAGKEYYFDGCLVMLNGSPAMVNGWKLESGNWVYYKNSVKLTNCWQLDSTGWCYLTADGTMATNKWIKDSAGWCYVGANGYCLTNTWMKDSIGWCYLDSNGRMVTNAWVNDSNGKCWIDANGYWDGIYH